MGALACQLYCTVWHIVRGSTLPVHLVESKSAKSHTGTGPHVAPARYSTMQQR